MTTPATDNTAYAIICDACWDACLVPMGDDPNSEMLAKCQRRLNQIITEEITETQGLWLWVDTAIALVAGQGQYVMGPGGVANVTTKPMQIRDQYYQYSTANGGTRRPVSRLSRIEWDMLSSPSQQGPITQIFVDPQQSVLNVNTWLVPDTNEATGTLHLVLMQRVTQFTGLTDAMSFPLEWALFLHWKLASEICQGQPPAIVNRCDGKAAYYKEKLEEWDAEQETSITFQPDQRVLPSSRFRS